MRLAYEGLDEVDRKIEQLVTDFSGAGFEQVIGDSIQPIKVDAQANAPNDQGNLVNSIEDVVIRDSSIVEGIVGSKLFYAPFQEYGTGVFVGRKPHWPPGRALQGWALRHGFSSGFVVARIIGMRGGLRPVKYLGRAFEANISGVVNSIKDGVGRLVRK